MPIYTRAKKAQIMSDPLFKAPESFVKHRHNYNYNPIRKTQAPSFLPGVKSTSPYHIVDVVLFASALLSIMGIIGVVIRFAMNVHARHVYVPTPPSSNHVSLDAIWNMITVGLSYVIR